MCTERRAIGPRWSTAAHGLATALVAALALAPTAALGQAPESSEAEALFHDGVGLLREGRYGPARAVLERALALEPRATTAFNLASALHALGLDEEAHALLVRIDAGALGALPSAYAQPEQALRESVMAALAQLEVEVSGAPSAQVTVDGEAAGVARAESPLTLALAPGSRLVEARAVGAEPWRARVSLEAGELERVHVLFSRLADTVAGTVAEAPAERAAPEPGGGPDWGLIVGVGVGVLLAGAAALVIGLVVDAQPDCDPLLGCVEF